MGSLSEKRIKVRYSIVQKTEWTDDSSKFGQRMLEKMGWKQGVGLGKEENGRVEHISLAFKDNVKGVGYVRNKYDDTWVHHQDGFNNILEQLKQEHSPTINLNTSSTEQTTNLVKKLDATKRRFSYKKQSHGKDLSMRSSSDLDCVFGWNKIKQIKQEDERAVANNIIEKKELDEENKNIIVESIDVQYVTSKQSVQDYFKQKAKQLLLARQQKVQEQEKLLDVNRNEDEDELKMFNDDESEIKHKRKKHKKNHVDEQVEQETELVETKQETNYITTEQPISKKKKKHKIEHLTEDAILTELKEEDREQQQVQLEIEDEIKAEKKKKKKKRHHSESLDSEQANIELSTSVEDKPQLTMILPTFINSLDFSSLFPGSNLPNVAGYEGYHVDKSLDEVIRLKAKQKRNKQRQKHKLLTSNSNIPYGTILFFIYIRFIILYNLDIKKSRQMKRVLQSHPTNLIYQRFRFQSTTSTDAACKNSHRISSFIQSKLMTAEDVAYKLPKHLTLGTSGFTPAGYPKMIVPAYAKRIMEAKKRSGDNNEFSINLFTGASVGDELDGVLARTGTLKLRIPYQSHIDIRKLINNGNLNYIDMHLSHVGRYIREGIFPPIDVAIVEACDVTSDGRIYLTNSSGMSGTYLALAKDIYIELNEAHPMEMKGLHDMFLPDSLHGRPINIDHVDDRIGTPYFQVDPKRIKGIVRTNVFDSAKGFKKPDDISFKIANNILEFILNEVDHGRR
ncbi:unnamed protein product [Didymodactylos carnosus]|uniref:Acetyl-CoA hydrolase n=1 Tax=Didymodactylos carnosus TaxID=1234261 RepID=A0A8S2EKQ6_9BILA|nr:unnamed protein product [Didymodactylos carnosus]CAF4009870.1 unnamed protein product [Didymodactylos carnosus]